VSGQAAKAQEFLCRQAERYASYADEITAHVQTRPAVRFSWIQGREVG
jgi:acyl-[acyl-carrier-protein] desaturase